MAKVTSAERVSPITRANYAGNLDEAKNEAEYDPLAALASLVGNIENDAEKIGGQTAEEPAFNLETELVKDFHDAENYNPQQQSNFNELENELAYALDAGVPDMRNPDQNPQGGVEAPLPAAADPMDSEPVMQSLASLHTAFGVEPQPGNDSAAPTDADHSQLVDALSDEAMIESQLLAELHIARQQSPHVEPAVSELPNNAVAGAANAERHVTIPPIEQFQPSEPFAEVAAAVYQSDAAEIAGAEPTELRIDEAFSSEFEAAISGDVAAFAAEPPIAQSAVPADAGLAPVNTGFQDDMPFGTLEDAVTMPAVNTPFDHQVDHALSDIIHNEAQSDSQIDWSGDLSEELQGIVSSSSANVAPAPVSPAPVAAVPVSSEAPAPVASAPVVPEAAIVNELDTSGLDDYDMTSPVEAAGTYPAVDTSISDPTDFSAFEQELANQLNPDFDAEPFVGIPEAPELAEAGTKKRGGMGVAFGVLGVAAVIAAGAFSWNYFSTDQTQSSVPTLLASSDPVKIKPKEPGGVKIPNQDQVVFEQVNGNATDKTSQERLASGTETPIRVVTAGSTPPVVQPLPITNSSAPAKSSARVSASDTILVRSEQAIVSPRKVRTVTVRPDGTIVAAKTGVPVRKVKPIKVASTNKIENFVEPIAKLTPPVVAALPTQTSAEVTTSTVPIRKIDVVPVQPIGSGVDKLRTATSPIEVVKTKPVAIAEPRKVKVQPIKKITPVKKVQPVSKPVKLASTSAGGYVMQISSQRSAEAAQSSYSRLSRKFSGILGGKGVDIRRFKLKDKGIYYRVRIPAGSKKSAINLCTRYKSAGGSCFVTR